MATTQHSVKRVLCSGHEDVVCVVCFIVPTCVWIPGNCRLSNIKWPPHSTPLGEYHVVAMRMMIHLFPSVLLVSISWVFVHALPLRLLLYTPWHGLGFTYMHSHWHEYVYVCAHVYVCVWCSSMDSMGCILGGRRNGKTHKVHNCETAQVSHKSPEQGLNLSRS